MERVVFHLKTREQVNKPALVMNIDFSNSLVHLQVVPVQVFLLLLDNIF